MPQLPGHTLRPTTAALLALLNTALFSGASAAEEDASDDFYDLSLQQLLVTEVEVGSFFKEKIEDVGSTVSLVTRDEWRKRGSKSVTQAVSHIPGIHQNTHSDLENVVVRGYQTATSYTGVLILVDNIPLNSYTFSSATQRVGLLDSYEQIEVIKGPGSTLYGSDAFSGLMSLKTWDSDKDISEYGLEYGNFGDYGATLKHSQGIGEKLRASINIVAQGVDDEEREYDYLGLDDQLGSEELENHRNTNSIIAKLSYENTKLMVYSHHLNSRGGGFGFNFVPLTSDGNQVDRHTDMDLFSLTHNQPINGTGEIVFKAYHWESESFADYGLQAGPIGDNGSVNIDQEEIRSGGDIKYLYNNKEDLKFVAGLTYEEIESGDQASFGQPASYGNNTRIVKSALFNADYTFAEGKAKVIVGGRFDTFNDIDEDHFSPRLGFNYYYNDNNTFKALYGNSFRAPNIQEISGLTGSVIGGGKELKPENNDTYELIHIYQDKQFSLNSTIFFSVFEDAINLSETVPLQYINSEESESWGVEVESKYKRGQFSYYGSVSYVDSYVKEPEKDSSFYEGFPDWLINYGLDYSAKQWPVDFSIYNTHRYGAKTLDNSDSINVEEGKSISPYVRTDFVTTYYMGDRSDNNTLYFQVRNLFDRDNYISGNLGSYEGRKEPSLNAVIGFRYSM
ncbi:TonB-dependent receptor plug domain-containing protein [Oceanicoccus sagamiensis]|uniref:TonB-dependent receptor n=1 Tax=Oceanicoccus sagamiensis TaxID=716816 RepID=A0A1X9NAN9_9GAMM|nr:TonB-dependent receptor [Oceanicoccus sagamiensis]ARN73502.1 hypothetical protein BST96_04845 [Oceanicoccus sagamiensis]